jgi:hypothetical protein
MVRSRPCRGSEELAAWIGRSVPDADVVRSAVLAADADREDR